MNNLKISSVIQLVSCKQFDTSIIYHINIIRSRRVMMQWSLFQHTGICNPVMILSGKEKVDYQITWRIRPCIVPKSEDF